MLREKPLLLCSPKLATTTTTNTSMLVLFKWTWLLCVQLSICAHCIEIMENITLACVSGISFCLSKFLNLMFRLRNRSEQNKLV